MGQLCICHCAVPHVAVRHCLRTRTYLEEAEISWLGELLEAYFIKKKGDSCLNVPSVLHNSEYQLLDLAFS